MTDASRYFQEIDPTDDSAHSRVLRAIGRAGRVLELGPGPGHVTELLAAAGNDVTCVELDAGAAASARRFATRVEVADLDVTDLTTLLAGEIFDALSAADVLEHLRHPHRTLHQAASLVKPGGTVVVSLPNVAHVDIRLALLNGRWDYKEHGLLDLTHLRFFTRASAVRLLTAVGLEITEIQAVEWPPFTTNLGASPTDAPADVLDRILADPDASALQFVLVARVPDGGVPPAGDGLEAAALCTHGVYGEFAGLPPAPPAPTVEPATAAAPPPRTGRWFRRGTS